MRALFALGALAAVGCACGPSLPEPRVLSVSPGEIEQGQAPQLTLAVEVVLGVYADHRAQSLTAQDAVTVRVGGRPAPLAFLETSARVRAQAPLGLLPGEHAVELELSDGRVGHLQAGLRVLPGSVPDGFSIDPIADQRRGQPFWVTVRALGPAAPRFGGQVQLSVNRGLLTPQLSQPFEAGILVQQFTVGSAGQDVVLTVDDDGGRTASSNPFAVSP